MILTATEFQNLKHKNVTLLGMSGVGKTYLSSKLLETNNWFHYSGDYRIGTRYLQEPILDNIKQQIMQVEPLANLLRSDSIYIASNMSIDNLAAVTDFLGKPGNPDLGGLTVKELKYRHNLHRKAEIQAMHDVPDFINKSQSIYRYQHFINDAGGSLCDLEDDTVFHNLSKHTLILYIKASDSYEDELVKRSYAYPKPLFYRSDYIDLFISQYLKEKKIDWVACIDPDEFTRWVFSRLLELRKPSYQAISNNFGYQVSADQISQVRDEKDFFALVAQAIDDKKLQKT